MKIVVMAALFAFAAADSEYYPQVYEQLDIDAIVADLPRLQSFAGCILDTVPCSEEDALHRKIAAEAIATACKKCTLAHKIIVRSFITGLKTHLPEEYKHLKSKYDPENKYFDDFEKEILKM